MSVHARRLKELRDQLIRTEGVFLPLIRRVLANINTAAFAKIDPAITVEFPIGGADRVRMNTKAPRQFARAWQPLSRAQVAADYAQPNLRDELLPQRHFAAFGKPQAHRVGAMISLEFIDRDRSEEHTSELQSQSNLVCRLLLEKKKNKKTIISHETMFDTESTSNPI